jgi:hypothetical protein
MFIRMLCQLMEKLKASGMGGAKFFTAKDFEGLSPDELSKKFGNEPSKSAKRKQDKPTRSKSKRSTQRDKQDEDFVEL